MMCTLIMQKYFKICTAKMTYDFIEFRRLYTNRGSLNIINVPIIRSGTYGRLVYKHRYFPFGFKIKGQPTWWRWITTIIVLSINLPDRKQNMVAHAILHTEHDLHPFLTRSQATWATTCQQTARNWWSGDRSTSRMNLITYINTWNPKESVSIEI